MTGGAVVAVEAGVVASGVGVGTEGVPLGAPDAVVEALAGVALADGVAAAVVAFGTTTAGDFALVATIAGAGVVAAGMGGSIGAGEESSPAVAGAGMTGRLSFDASSMRWAAARVFMNPAVYTTRIAAELSVTRRFATFLLEALGAMGRRHYTIRAMTLREVLSTVAEVMRLMYRDPPAA